MGRRDWLVCWHAGQGRLEALGENLDLARRGHETLALSGRVFDRSGETQETAQQLLERNVDEVFGRAAPKGVFVVLLASSASGELAATRDPTGLHPLFFRSEDQDRLWLSSSPGLLASLPPRPRLSRLMLVERLLHRWPLAEDTPWEGVYRVPAGRVLRWRRGEARLADGWSPESSVGLAEGELDELLARAVARMSSAGPTAIFLSGGLDSVCVALAARDLGVRPLAASVFFPHPDCDERETQRQVAEVLGLELLGREFDDLLGGGSWLEAALALAADWPGLLTNPWAVVYLTLARLVNERGKQVVLSGAGGDEWLGVSPFLAADLWARGSVHEVWRLGCAHHASHDLSWARTSFNLGWRFGLRPLLAGRLALMSPAWMSRWRQGRLRRGRPSWLARDRELAVLLSRREHLMAEQVANRDFYLHEIRRGLGHALVSMEAEESWELGRRAGLELVAPFWDAEVVARLYATPPLDLIDGGWAKSPLRQRVRRQLPALALERRRKVSALDFFRERLLAEAPAILRRLGGLVALGELGVVARPAAEALLESIVRERRSIEIFRLWDMLSLEVWSRCQLEASRATFEPWVPKHERARAPC